MQEWPGLGPTALRPVPEWPPQSWSCRFQAERVPPHVLTGCGHLSEQTERWCRLRAFSENGPRMAMNCLHHLKYKKLELICSSLGSRVDMELSNPNSSSFASSVTPTTDWSQKQSLSEAVPSQQATWSCCPQGVDSPCSLPCRISYDPARYPKYLPEAYCLCRGCLTGPFGEEDFRFRSTPVFVPAVVLRRTPACAGGRSVYTEEYVTVPVGCTCVPEQEKEADSVNSSMDKPGSKLLLSPSDKPGRP
ncbi:interleukin-17D isoform X1 [Camelus dromedarius]